MASSSSSSSKHIMLSYNQKDQDLVTKIYDYLKSQNLAVWMDSQGGMKDDVYDSMAKAVQNASTIVCFLNSAYQSSDNCRKELEYAARLNVPAVFCRLEDYWKPSGWLGIITAGELLINLKKVDETNFEQKASEILDRIHVEPNGHNKQSTIPNDGKQQKAAKSSSEDSPSQYGRLDCGGRRCPKCHGCLDWNNGPGGGCKDFRRGGLIGLFSDPKHGYRDTLPRCLCSAK